MEKTVRILRIADQDRFRREDCARLSPNARLDALLNMRDQFLAQDAKPLRRVVRIAGLTARPHA